MKQIIKITAVLLIFIFIAAFVGCEIFDGQPQRNNQNDPEAVNKEYSVETYIRASLNDVFYSFEIEGGFDRNEISPQFEVFYGLEPDIFDENNFSTGASIVDNGGEVQITENLSYGNIYNFWLVCTDENTGDFVFMKHDVATLEAQGKLCSAFNNGAVLTGFGEGAFTYEKGVTRIVAADTNIFISGFRQNESSYGANFIQKLDSNGSLISSFGGDGEIVSNNHNGPSNKAYMLLWDDVAPVLWTIVEANYSEILYRQGAADDGSAPDGTGIGDFGIESGFWLSGEEFVVAGYNITNDPGILKIDLGTPPDVVNDYMVTPADLNDNAVDGIFTDIAISDDRSFIIAVGTIEDAGSTFRDMIVLKLGLPNMTELGHIVFDADSAWDNAIDSGYFQVAFSGDGTNSFFVSGNMTLGKFAADLQAVQSFGFESGGIVGLGSFNFEPFEMIAQSDGKVLLCGNIMPGGIDGRIARILSDGSVDSSFAGDGVFKSDDCRFEDFDITEDGRIIAVGVTSAGDGAVYCLE